MLGLVNGFLVAVCGVPSIIATLGTMSIFRSVLTSHAGGTTISTGSLPAWLVDLPRSTVVTIGSYEVRTMFVIAVVIVVALHLTLLYTRAGRHLYGLGSNPAAARQAGLDRRRLQLVAFGACGALAGLAGFLYVGRFGNINVTAGSGLELAAIAAAVVGGVSTLGGSGTIMGAFLGAVLIGVLDQSLVRVEQISEFWRDAILGALILFAVLLDVGVGRRLAGAGAHARRSTSSVVRTMDSWARRYSWELLLLTVLVGTIVFNLTQSSGYVGVDNFVNLFQLHIEKVIIVVTMTFVIVAGEIDLSVASVMAWSAAVLAALHERGAPLGVAIVAALAAAALAGLVQGWCVARLGLPSLVVTLAGLIGWRGAARVLVEDRSIGGFPSWFDDLGQDDLLGPLPLALVLFVVLFAVGATVLHRSAAGRRLFVIGDNAEVARYSGRRRRPHPPRAVRRLGVRRRRRRRAVRRPPRHGPRRHGDGLRARGHHDRAPRWGQHLRRCRTDERGPARRADRPQPAQRTRPGERRRKHPDRRHRGDPHRLRAGPERHPTPERPGAGATGTRRPAPRPEPVRL